MSVKELSGNLIAKGIRLGIVASRFNDFLTRQLVAGAVDCVVRHGGSEDDVVVAWVPGANEIPMAVHDMVKCGRFNAIVGLGAVVQGATPHADLINTQVARALTGIGLEAGVVVINGVVSADNLEQAIERCGTKAGNKGWVAAQAAIEMVNLRKAVEKLS